VLAFLVTGASGAVLGAVFAFILVSPVVAVAVLAWHRGCHIIVLPAVLFVMSLLVLSIDVSNSPNLSIFRFYTDIPSVPVYIAVFLIGVEWTIRTRNKVSEFLPTVPGMVSAVFGVAHVFAGMALQFRARPREMNRLLGFDTLVSAGIPHIDILGVFLVVFALFVVVVLPAFLWYNDGLLAPIAMITGWVALGAWLNYLWWDAHPVNPIRGLGATYPPFLPAPDYAVMVYVPLLLILLTTVFEGYARRRN